MISEPMTDLDAHLDVQNLMALGDPELAKLGELRVSKRQEFLGGSFSESLNAWRKAPPQQVLGLCFLFGTAPVGLTLFKRPPLSPPWASVDAATIHGLKIATPWQGRGWGHIAFGLAVHRLKEEWPDRSTLMLAVDADNAAALAVYRAFGMIDSGPIFDGHHGREHRLRVTLNL